MNLKKDKTKKSPPYAKDRRDKGDDRFRREKYIETPQAKFGRYLVKPRSNRGQKLTKKPKWHGKNRSPRLRFRVNWHPSFVFLSRKR